MPSAADAPSDRASVGRRWHRGTEAVGSGTLLALRLSKRSPFLRRRIWVRAATRYFAGDPSRSALMAVFSQSRSTGCDWWDYWLLHRYVAHRQPKRILELGSGVSTAVLADAARGDILSVEESGEWAEETRRLLTPSMRARTSVSVVPRIEDTWRREFWGFRYADLPKGPFDFIFVDGPSSHRDAYASRHGMQGVCLDLLYLLESHPQAVGDVIIDGRKSSALAYASVLPRGVVRYDHCLRIGVIPQVRGLQLVARQSTVSLLQADPWWLLEIPHWG